MTWSTQLPVIILLLGTVVGSAGAEGLPPGAVQVQPGSELWKAGQPGLPPGAQIAVLEGDPAGAGMFTIRLKVPAGTSLEPHWHPADERVTVLEGEVWVGFGPAVKRNVMRRLPAGSFYLNPAKAPHFLMFSQDSVVQVTGIGPWKLYPVKQ